MFFIFSLDVYRASRGTSRRRFSPCCKRCEILHLIVAANKYLRLVLLWFSRMWRISPIPLYTTLHRTAINGTLKNLQNPEIEKPIRPLGADTLASQCPL